MNGHRRVRVRTAVRGLGLTVLLWAVLVALAEWRGAHWPAASDGWQSLILLAVIVEFLWLKSWMMGAMTRHWDRLGSSLIAANVAFSVVYVYALGASLFPAWYLAHAADARYPIRGGLILVLGWGIAQLLLVPDPADDAPEEPEGAPTPTCWERTASAAERTAAATEELATRGRADLTVLLEHELAWKDREILRLKRKCGESVETGETAVG